MTVNIKIVALISFIALLSGNSHAENYEKSVINHRLILKGAESSGIEFIGSDKVVMYAEITGDMPIVEARVKWIGNTFSIWSKMDEIVLSALHVVGYIK
ncbi:hypothetical protein [Plesiomonas shigelloides]|uniref:hypothetical protein n=1 Tax=Plesiomonas shigelloides TaxID=703 RepID=UPI000E0FB8EA|nr:hypothetical protein [Plesiomonas shigelloides]